MVRFIFSILGLLLTSGLISQSVYAVEDKNTIRIGVTVSLEGQFEEPSKMGQESFDYWVQEVNEKGGLLGRQVSLIKYDDKSDRELTRTLYRRFLEEDNVDFVFAPYSTPLTLAASEFTEKHNTLLLAIAAAAEKPWQGDARYLFQLYAPASRQLIGLLDMMAKKGLRKIAIIHDDTSDFNRDMVKGVLEWAELFKINTVFQKGYTNGKEELPDLLTNIKELDPDGVIISAYPPDSYELLRLMGKMAYKPKVLAMPIVPNHPDFLNKVGDIGDRVFAPSQWEPDERIPFPGSEKFVKGFSEFTGHMPSFHAASAYAACQLLEQAVEQTQSLDHTQLRNYIAALNTVTVLGRFKVDPSGLQVGHNSFIIQWQKGKKEIVWPQKMRTAKPQF